MVHGKKRPAALLVSLLLAVTGGITVFHQSNQLCCAADENEMTEIPILPNSPNDPTEEGEKGDVNEDGVISMEDAMLILDYYARCSANKEAAFSENAAENERRISLADCNEDGVISIEDAFWVLSSYAKAAAGL